jgi:hypothetical protein
MPASTVRAAASSGAISPVVSERVVRSAILRTCLSHPDTFLSDATIAKTHAHSLVSALLPIFVGSTEPQDTILCEAFAAADACNVRRAQLAAAADVPVRVAEAPACQPMGAAAAIPSPEGVEFASAQCVQPGVVFV